MCRLHVIVLGALVLCAAGCTSQRDRTHDPDVRQSRIVGKEFVLAQPARLYRYQNQSGLTPTAKALRYHTFDETLDSGLRLKITRVIDVSNRYYTTAVVFARFLDGPMNGDEVCINDYFPQDTILLSYCFWDEGDLVPSLASPPPWSDLNGDAAADKMIQSLQSPDWALRWYAARALGAQSEQPPSVIAALRNAQSDTDQDVRLRATISLSQFKSIRTSIVEKAIADLEVLPPLAEFECLGTIKTLGSIGAPAVEPILRSIAKGHSDASRRIEALGAIGTAARPHLSAIIATLSQTGNLAGPWAAKALTKIDAADSLRQLLPLVDNKPFNYEASWTIFELARTATGVAPYLIEKLHSGSPQARQCVVRALRSLPDPPETTLPPLLESLHDPDAEVRMMSIWSATDIAFRYQSEIPGVKAAIEPLRNDSDPKVRERAVSGVSDLDRWTAQSGGRPA